MKRTLPQWSGMVPEVVAEGSKAQIVYALADAKADIAELSAQVAELRNELYRRGQEADQNWLTERERAW